jgi:hypothetical protein
MFKLFDPYKRFLKKMGFPADQQGYIHRFLWEESNWFSHLEKTKTFIIQSIGETEGKKLAILGSGWLIFLPMDFLFSRFEKILLFDILHPAQIYHKYRNDKRIEFHFADITGDAIMESWQIFKTKNPEKLNEIPSVKFELPADVNFVVSHNLLSQLDTFPADFLEERLKIDKEELFEFRKRIQKNHIELLGGRNACLITDVMEIWTDEKGEVGERKTVYVDLPISEKNQEWEWVFDTRGDYHEGCETKLLVKAICF